MPDRWDDLSDTELRQRLERRGCPPEVALWLVDHREQETAAQRITAWLAR